MKLHELKYNDGAVKMLTESEEVQVVVMVKLLEEVKKDKTHVVVVE